MGHQTGLSEEEMAALDALSARLAAATYYELLGVPRDAPRSQIRSAFFALSKRFHPDRFFRSELGPRKAQLEQVFAALSRAYETLSRPAVRRMYDAQLDDPGSTEKSEQGSPARAAGPGAAGQGARSPAPASAPGAETGAKTRSPAKRRPSAHVARQMAARLRAREAEEAARQRSVMAPPPAHGRKNAATALARELIRHASQDELRLRSYLRNAEAAEREERWGDAYRALSMAQPLSPNDVTLIRRMERAHRSWMVQKVPEHMETAREAEQAGRHGEAALYWLRVAEATDDPNAHLAAARNYLRNPQPAEQAKAGRPARRAVELMPHDLKANKVLLEFFQLTGMSLSASRQREVLAKLKRGP